MLQSLVVFRRHRASLRRHFDPGMLQDLVGRVTLQRVDLQHPRNQLFSRIGDLVPVRRVKLEQSAQDLIEQFLLVVGSRRERGVADEQDVHDDTGGPDVDLDSVAGLGKDFGSDISGGSAD